MSENVSFSTGAAAKAEGMLTAMETGNAGTTTVETPASTSPQATATATASEATPAPQTTAETVVAPTPIEVAEDALIRIKVDGKEQLVPFKTLRDGGIRQETFTQRTQQLAEQRRQAEEHIARQLAHIQQEARAVELAKAQLAGNDPARTLAEALAKIQNPEKPQNPNEIATLGDIERILAEVNKNVDGKVASTQTDVNKLVQERVDGVLAQIEIQRGQERFNEAVRSVMGTENGKLLADINPEAEKLLRWTVYKMGPESLDQSIEYLSKAATDWADKVRGKFSQQTVTAAVKQAKTVMEAPQGTTPTVVKATPSRALTPTGGIDWDVLNKRANAILESMEG